MIHKKCDRVIVISLPTSRDRRKTLENHFRTMNISFEYSNGVIVEEEELLWKEMRQLEAYKKPEYLRNFYPLRAVGCRRAGLNALKMGYEKSTAEGFIICQDDVLFVSNAKEKISKCLTELPEEANLLWFDRKQITQPEEQYSENLNILRGARLCTAFWISKKFAGSLIQKLEIAEKEWDVFMEEEMGVNKNIFVSKDPIASQREGTSVITFLKKWIGTK